MHPLAWRLRFTYDLLPDWLPKHSSISPELAASLLLSICGQPVHLGRKQRHPLFLAVQRRGELKWPRRSLRVSPSDLRDVLAFAYGNRRFEHSFGLRRFVCQLFRAYEWEMCTATEMMICKVVLQRDKSEQKWKMKKNVYLEELRRWTRNVIESDRFKH